MSNFEYLYKGRIVTQNEKRIDAYMEKCRTRADKKREKARKPIHEVYIATTKLIKLGDKNNWKQMLSMSRDRFMSGNAVQCCDILNYWTRCKDLEIQSYDIIITSFKLVEKLFKMPGKHLCAFLSHVFCSSTALGFFEQKHIEKLESIMIEAIQSNGDLNNVAVILYSGCRAHKCFINETILIAVSKYLQTADVYRDVEHMFLRYCCAVYEKTAHWGKKMKLISKHGVIRVIFKGIDRNQRPTTTRYLLETIDAMLRNDKSFQTQNRIEDCGGVDKIETIANNAHGKLNLSGIYDICGKILDKINDSAMMDLDVD